MKEVFTVLFCVFCLSTTQKSIYLDSIIFNTVCGEPSQDFYFLAQSFSETAETGSIIIPKELPQVSLGTTYQVNTGLVIWAYTVDNHNLNLDSLTLAIHNQKTNQYSSQADPLISHFTVRWDDLPVSSELSPERRRFNGVSNRGECQISTGSPEVSIWLYATDSSDQEIGNAGLVSLGGSTPEEDSSNWQQIIVIVIFIAITFLCFFAAGYCFLFRGPSKAYTAEQSKKHIEIPKRFQSPSPHDLGPIDPHYRQGPLFQSSPSPAPHHHPAPQKHDEDPRHLHDRGPVAQPHIEKSMSMVASFSEYEQAPQQQRIVNQVIHPMPAPTTINFEQPQHHPQPPQSVILSSHAPTTIQTPTTTYIPTTGTIIQQPIHAPTIIQAPPHIQQPINQQMSVEFAFLVEFHPAPTVIAQSVIHEPSYTLVQAPNMMQARSMVQAPILIQQPQYAYSHV